MLRNATNEADSRSRFRVLVIDDNQDAADSLALLLRLRGYESRAAYSGEAGLEEAAAFRPDCLVLDIGMPGLDGYEVARRVRRDALLSRSRLIALSAYSSDEYRRQANEAGFDHYLVKPADPRALEGLLTMLQHAIKLAERTEALAQQNVQLAQQTRELLGEVKTELREVKEELKEVKDELKTVRSKSNETI